MFAVTLPLTIPPLRPGYRWCTASADQRVNAPASGPVEDHEKKDPAIEDGEFTVVRKLRTSAADRDKFGHRCCGRCNMQHEISHREHAAADEGSESGKQPKSDRKTANQLDPASYLHQHFFRAGHPAKHSENQLPAMTGEHQPSNEPHDAVNRIRVTIESVHGARLRFSSAPCQARGKPLADG